MRTGPLPLAAAILAASLLAACGGDDDSSGSATTAGSGGTSAAAPASSSASSSPSTAAGGGAATTAAPGIVRGADPEVDEVVAAYSAVFDSAVPYDAKATHLAEAEQLRPVVDAYAAAGGRFGGIKLVPTAVTIDGDQAAVTYDVMFGTTPQYRALQGAAVRQDGTWKVTRDEFCSFMASARTPCPAS